MLNRPSPVSGLNFILGKLKRGVQLWKVAGAVFKSELYRLLRLNPPTDDELAEDGEWPAGYVHIPKGTPAEWFRQLTAEHLMVTKTRQGFQKLEWQQMRERNEALDCRVYARAAAWLIVRFSIEHPHMHFYNPHFLPPALPKFGAASQVSEDV